mgnify:CR=1 FL=1
MIEVGTMGPGFFIFFQDEIDHNSWHKDLAGKKKREENEIIVILSSMYEAGAF